MKFSATRAWMLGLAAVATTAGAVPVSVDLTGLRAIQTYDLNKGDDQAYVLIGGTAAGKDVAAQQPKETPWKVGPKAPVGSAKAPIPLWAGDLAEGQYAVLTVTLYQGKGNDAKVKEFADKLAAAEKPVFAGVGAKVAATDDVDKLAVAMVKAEQPVVKDVKKTLSRDASTDHFGGLFNVTVANAGGKIVKRIDPVGLTFGEHYGTDAKIYTKLKLTRANVLMKDEGSAEWGAQQLTPLNDDQNAVRVKMLETEPVKGATPPKHVTDYLAEVQVKADGKALTWDLAGDHPGPSELHEYWDYAK